jgi:hypothetical protein
MYSEVSICKEALALLGQTNIISLDDDSKAARLCKQFYSAERNKLLRRHPWSFALKQAEFAETTDVPVYAYSHVYRLPGDCLKFVRPAVLQTKYAKIGPKIYTNEVDFQGLYVYEITNPVEFDVLFVDALAIAIAKKMCVPLISNRNRALELHEEYKEAIAQAKSNNAFETYAGATETTAFADGFIRARSWGGNR